LFLSSYVTQTMLARAACRLQSKGSDVANISSLCAISCFPLKGIFEKQLFECASTDTVSLVNMVLDFEEERN
jgi:hypothetical protein